MSEYRFEFLSRAVAFDRKTTDDRPAPARVIVVEAADERQATREAFAQLKPRERSSLVCANVIRPA